MVIKPIKKDRCHKRCYPSRKEAKKVLKDINHWNDGKRLTDVYYCEACSAWHLTSINKKKSRKYKRFWKLNNTE